MKLTKKKAIELSIKLWTWLAETGKEKEEWPVWDKYDYAILNDCFLCEYDDQKRGGCNACPLTEKFSRQPSQKFGCYADDCAYSQWEKCESMFAGQQKTAITEDHKKYAALFLAQLKELK